MPSYHPLPNMVYAIVHISQWWLVVAMTSLWLVTLKLPLYDYIAHVQAIGCFMKTSMIIVIKISKNVTSNSSVLGLVYSW